MEEEEKKGVRGVAGTENEKNDMAKWQQDESGLMGGDSYLDENGKSVKTWQRW